MGKKIIKPKVTVLVTTYNHEEYIRDALDGILMQKTNFMYNIVIHDDASPDNTQDIIREYELEYPNIITAIYQTENKFSKGESIFLHYVDYLNGEYISRCEGDDYWTSSNKLQKQVDFLDKNSEFVATSHNVKVIDENYKEVSDELNEFRCHDEYIFRLEDAIKRKSPGQLASILHRNIWIDLDERVLELYLNCKANGDRKLAVLLTNFGDIYCFKDIMANHRKIVSQGTSWSARNHNKNLALHYYTSLLEIKKFEKEAFGIVVNNKKQRKNIYISALLKFISKPTKENKNVIKEINKIKEESYLQLYSYILYKIVSWPVRKLYRKLSTN